MISGITISGFKAFGAEVHVPLRPLTLIFGQNSSGKSSILQAIMAVHQSWSSPKDIQLLETHGRRVELGRFGGVLHQAPSGETSDAVSIGFGRRYVNGSDDGSDEPQFRLTWLPGSKRSTSIYGELASVSCFHEGFDFRFNATTDSESRGLTLTLHISSIREWVELHPDDKETLEAILDYNGMLQWHVAEVATWPARFLPAEALFSDIDTIEERANLEEQVQSANEKFQESFSAPGRDRIAPVRLWELAEQSLEQVFLRYHRQLQPVAHIGPLRHRGHRVFTARCAREPLIGHSGENLGPALSEEVWWGTAALAETNRLLRYLGIEHQLQIRDVEGAKEPLRELLLVSKGGDGDDSARGAERGIPDVGSGISQVLPVLAQLAVSRVVHEGVSDVLVLVEQPELHLHPRLQAQLPAALAAAVNAHEDTQDRSPVQVLVETHSEHLVLGLCNLVADGRVDADQVLILCVANKDGVSGVEVVRIDPLGGFQTAWPGGFFPERERLYSGDWPTWEVG